MISERSLSWKHNPIGSLLLTRTWVCQPAPSAGSPKGISAGHLQWDGYSVFHRAFFLQQVCVTGPSPHRWRKDVGNESKGCLWEFSYGSKNGDGSSGLANWHCPSLGAYLFHHKVPNAVVLTGTIQTPNAKQAGADADLDRHVPGQNLLASMAAGQSLGCACIGTHRQLLGSGDRACFKF